VNDSCSEVVNVEGWVALLKVFESVIVVLGLGWSPPGVLSQKLETALAKYCELTNPVVNMSLFRLNEKTRLTIVFGGPVIVSVSSQLPLYVPEPPFVSVTIPCRFAKLAVPLANPVLLLHDALIDAGLAEVVPAVNPDPDVPPSL